MVYENSDSLADIKRIFEYDNDNIKRQLFISYSEGKQEQWETKYKYDKFNNVIECVEVDNKGDRKKTIYTYKYDRNGNWIYKACIENGIVISMFERKVEYFKLRQQKQKRMPVTFLKLYLNTNYGRSIQ